MSLDRANRSFLALVAVATLVGALVLWGMLGGVLIPLLVSRIRMEGFGALASTSTIPASALMVLAMAGVGVGARSLARQLSASRRLARYVSAKAVAAPAALRSATASAGLHDRVTFVDAPESFSFVYGLLTPRIAISRGMVAAASPSELGAVIEHERYHVRNLDPLKIVLARSLSAALCFLPALGALRARYLADCELAADRQALTRCGERSLAGALVKAVRGPDMDDLSVAASIGGADLLDIRVTQLETGAPPKLASVNRSHIGLSILSAALLTLAYLASTYSLGGPAAVNRVSGGGLARTTVLGGLSCAIPFALATILLGLAAAARARRAAASDRDSAQAEIGTWPA